MLDAAILIAIGNSLYTIGKDVFSFHSYLKGKIEYKEKEKILDNNYILRYFSEDEYKNFSWSNEDKVESRLLDGQSVVYQIDEENRIKYKLINKSRQVLLCTKIPTEHQLPKNS